MGCRSASTKRGRGTCALYCLALLLTIVLFAEPSSVGAEDRESSGSSRQRDTRPSFPGFENFNDEELRSLASIARIGDKPLYTMTRYGDYGLDELLRTGRGEAAAYADHPFACSALAVLRPDQDILFARNFDWAQRVPLVIVRTASPTGYPSFSVAFAHDIVAWLENPTEETARRKIVTFYCNHS